MSTLTDLTMPSASGMPFNPDHFPHAISTYATVPTHGWEARRLILDSNLGTHMDAPAHFMEDGQTIDGTPLDVLVGAAQVIRLSHLGPRDAITPDLLSPSESVASSSIP